jgi:hypothetical protein
MTKATKDTFCQMTHKMMRATHWVSPLTGELIKLEPSQKFIWLWMESRFKFFSASGKQYFDNQDEIAAATGTSVSTVKRFILVLKKHGYVEVGKKRLVGFIESNSYVLTQPLILHCDKDRKRPVQPVVDAREAIAVSLPGIYQQAEAPAKVLQTFRSFAEEVDGVQIDDAPVMLKLRPEPHCDDPVPW